MDPGTSLPSSSDSEAFCGLAVALSGIGCHDLAIKTFHRAIDLDPQYAEAYYRLGLTYKKKGLFPPAAMNIRKAIRLDPGKADYYVDLGNVLYYIGRKPEAREYFKKAREMVEKDEFLVDLGHDPILTDKEE